MHQCVSSKSLFAPFGLDAHEWLEPVHKFVFALKKIQNIFTRSLIVLELFRCFSHFSHYSLRFAGFIYFFIENIKCVYCFSFFLEKKSCMVILLIAVSSEFNPFKWMNTILLIFCRFTFFILLNIWFHLYDPLDLIWTSIFIDSCPNYHFSNVQIKKSTQKNY